MTLAELIERLQWQLEGRLQWRAVTGEWFNRPVESEVPQLCHKADLYRRRPDPPPMPDEVWISEHNQPVRGFWEAHVGPETCKRSFGGTPVRYVRAGAVIPVSQLQWRHIITNGKNEWKDQAEPSVIEYRIKP